MTEVDRIARRSEARSGTERARRPGVAAVVGVSLAALASGTFATVAIGALAPELKVDLGFSRADIGLATALVFVGASVASPRAGTLTDRYGPSRMLGLSLGLFAIAVAVAAASPSAWLFLAAMAIGGVSYGGINPPTNVVIAGRISARLGFFMSLKQTGVPIGGFLAGIVLPPIAIAFSWRWAFGLAALVGLVVAASSVFLRGAAVLEGENLPRTGRRRVRRDWVVLGSFGFVMAGIQWVFLAYLVLYLTEGRDFGLRNAGLVLSVATACSVGGRLFWGWLSDRPGRRVSVLVLTSSIATAALCLFAIGIPAAALWPLAAITGAALVGWNGVFHAVVASRVGAEALGKASGQVMAFVFAGSVALPPLLGFASERTDSWTLLWAVAAGLTASAAGLLTAGLRKQPGPQDVSMPRRIDTGKEAV